MRSNLNTTSIKSEHFYKAYNLIAMGEHGSSLQNDNYFASFIYYLTKLKSYQSKLFLQFGKLFFGIFISAFDGFFVGFYGFFPIACFCIIFTQSE